MGGTLVPLGIERKEETLLGTKQAETKLQNSVSQGKSVKGK